MPTIETQGLSEDYTLATGIYDSLPRGDVDKSGLIDILTRVSKLSTPNGQNDCPPSVNVEITKHYYSCFFGDNGILRCTDSKYEEFTPEEAAAVICGEITFEEYDTLKGIKPDTNARIFAYTLSAVMVMAIIGAVIIF